MSSSPASGRWPGPPGTSTGFVRVCDALQLGVRLVGYVRAGQAGLDEFRGVLEALDASEFAPAQALLGEILEALA